MASDKSKKASKEVAAKKKKLLNPTKKSSAKSVHWWELLTKTQKAAYLKRHPNSKFGKAFKLGKSADPKSKAKPVAEKVALAKKLDADKLSILKKKLRTVKRILSGNRKLLRSLAGNKSLNKDQRAAKKKHYQDEIVKYTKAKAQLEAKLHY
jgi:hypothetical protein